VRFPEPWSSTSLAKQAVLGTARDIFALDSAFALIEGHPAPAPCEERKERATPIHILHPPPRI
jgi:hypothetical protein